MEPQNSTQLTNSNTKVINSSEQSNKMGRPTVITEEVVRKLQAAFQNGMSDTTACQYAKISRDTFYRTLKEDQNFSDKIADAKNFLKLLAGKRLAHILDKGSDRDAVPLVKFTLEKLEPEQFGDKGDTININQQFQYVDPPWFIAPQDITHGDLEQKTMAAELVVTDDEATLELSG